MELTSGQPLPGSVQKEENTATAPDGGQQDAKNEPLQPKIVQKPFVFEDDDDDEEIMDDPSLTRSVSIPTEENFKDLENMRNVPVKTFKQNNSPQKQKEVIDELILDDPDLIGSVVIKTVASTPSPPPARATSPKAAAAKEQQNTKKKNKNQFAAYIPDQAQPPKETQQPQPQPQKQQPQIVLNIKTPPKPQNENKPKQQPQQQQNYQANQNKQVERKPNKYQPYDNSQRNDYKSKQNSNYNQNYHKKPFDRRGSYDAEYKPRGTSTETVKSLLDQYLRNDDDVPTQKYEDSDKPRYYEVPLITDSRPLPKVPKEREEFPVQPKHPRLQINNKKTDLEKNRASISEEPPEKAAIKGPILQASVPIKTNQVESLASKLGIKSFQPVAPSLPKFEIKKAGLTISLSKPINNESSENKVSAVVIESSSGEGKGFVKEANSNDALSLLSAPQEENSSTAPQKLNNEENNSMQQPQLVPIRPISAPIIITKTQIENENEPSVLANEPKQQYASFKPNPFVIKASFNNDHNFSTDSDDEDQNNDEQKILNEIMGIDDDHFTQDRDIDFEPVNEEEQKEEEHNEEEQFIHEISPDVIETGEPSAIDVSTSAPIPTEPKQEEIQETETKEIESKETEIKEEIAKESPKPPPTKTTEDSKEDVDLQPTISKKPEQAGISGILFAGIIFVVVMILFKSMFK